METPGRYHFLSWSVSCDLHMLWSLLEPVTDGLSCRVLLIYTMQPQIHLSSLINCSSEVGGKMKHKTCAQKTGIVALLPVDYSHSAHIFLYIETKCTEMME